MRSAMLVAASATLLLCGSSSAEPILSKGMTIDTLDDRFNETGEKIKAPGFWARRVSCSMNVKATCRYAFEGNIGLIAIASKEGGEAESMALIFAGDSDPMSFMITLGIMATVIEPKITDGARKRIFSALMDGLKEGRDSETRTKVAVYKRSSNPTTGTLVTVEPR